MKGNAKMFIISSIKGLVSDIPEIKILYKFDTLSKEHLIKVLPLQEFKDNTDYHRWEEEILFDFIEEFPYDNLVFISDDDWIDIPEPEEVFEGVNFNKENIFFDLSKYVNIEFVENELFTFGSIEDDFVKLHEDVLQDYCKVQLEDIQPIIVSNVIDDDYYGTQLIEECCVFHEDSNKVQHETITDSKNDNSNCNTECGCNNYALAA